MKRTIVCIGLAVTLASLGVVAGDPQNDEVKVTVVKTGDGEQPKVTVIRNGEVVDPAEVSMHGGRWISAERPFLGITLESGDEGGVTVRGIVPGSPAEASGLQRGDRIVGFDGETIDDSGDLTRAIGEREIGDEVDVRVVRDGDVETFVVTLGESNGMSVFRLRDGDGPGAFAFELEGLEGLKALEGLEGLKALEGLEGLSAFTFHCEDGEDCEDLVIGDSPNVFIRHFGGKPLLGVSLTDTTPELREHLGGDRDRGVLVARVHEGLPAERAGLRVGDLIVSVDGDDVASSGELAAAVRRAAGQRARIDFVRDGRLSSVDVELPSDDEADGPDA